MTEHTSNTEDIPSLLFRFLAEEELTAQEQTQLEAWLSASPYNREVLEEANDPVLLRTRLRALENIDEDALWSRIFPAADTSIVRRIPAYRRWWVAASVLLIVLTGGYLWFRSAIAPEPSVAVTPHTKDVHPGQNGAILTLADGSEIVLDSLGNGIIATENGANVVLQDGRLAYDGAGKPGAALIYNTMTTPKGRQFRVQLPDGTKVWLNAASSIKYPTCFPEKERKVEVTGEVYFEVAENAHQPFRVNIGNKAEVEVLGTHFNVNAYIDEETINTTLLEGGVRVKKENTSVVLNPGQQAQVRENIRVLDNINLDKVIAWKNGVFNFHGDSLKEVMRQLARWYDIEVVYEGNPPSRKFEGEIGMDLKLSQVLKGLENMQIKFRMEEGNRLVVIP